MKISPVAAILINVAAMFIAVGPPSPPSALTLPQIMADARKSVVVVRTSPTSYGGGIIIARNGLILTNRHVVVGSEKIEVKYEDGTTHQAKLLRSAGDLALLGVGIGKAFEPIKFAAAGSYPAGTEIYLLGHPEKYHWSLHRGIISHESRDIEPVAADPIRGVLQFDAAVHRGSSGGALLNAAGELVGMAVARREDMHGIGFAIGAGELKKFIDAK